MAGDYRSSSGSPSAGSVNIEKAENAFHDLSRQLTQGTIVDDAEKGGEGADARTLAKSGTAQDLEKGASDAESPFDLREFLTSSNDANESAGIKHKRVGVVWEEFHVDVLGGSNFKVSLNVFRNHHVHLFVESGK